MVLFTAETTPLSMAPGDRLDCGLPIYRALLSSHPAEQLVLLESLGRRSTDARHTMVALNPVLFVTVRQGLVQLEGRPDLVRAAIAALSDYTPRSDEDGCVSYRLPEPAAVWNFLRALETAFAIEAAPDAAPLAFFGYFGYDTIRYIEAIPRRHAPVDDAPDIALTLYRTVITLDPEQATLTHYRYNGAEDVDTDALVRLCASASTTASAPPIEVPEAAEIRFETPQADYLEKCQRALEHIRLGDVYQIQIGQKLSIRTPLSPLDLYTRLRTLNPSPYMYLFSVGDQTVVGASPELYVRHEDGRILMRPIAGTVGKHPGMTRDAAETELRASDKEVAEHLMLVDLCRNDICRVCEPGSLDVQDVMNIEEYSHVFHMVSSITGTMAPGRDKYDAIADGFPAGTMTGTPKIRAVELIESLEDSARGLYAGAIGLIGLGSDYVNTALCIRSAVYADGIYTLRASAGLVADSSPDREYRETLHKLGSMYRAITGGELT